MLAASLVLLSAVAFRSLYLSAGRGPATRLASGPAARLTSSAHAAALSLLGALAAGWPELVSTPWWSCAAYALPLGYLAHDTALIWSEPSHWDPKMLVHHLTFAALVVAGAGKYPGMAARAYLAELSTPLLNAGWAMRRNGADKRYPRVFGSLCAALLLVFFIFRACALVALCLEAVGLGEWALGVLMAGLAALNWYWFCLLLRSAARAARGQDPEPGVAPPRTRVRPRKAD